MNSIEELKQQLILQKATIEKMGGSVIVKGTNPSPAEITAGIRTIPTTYTPASANINLSNPEQALAFEQIVEQIPQTEQEEQLTQLMQEETSQQEDQPLQEI